MIATLIQYSGGTQPSPTLGTFQVCPGTQLYSQAPPQSLTIGWDGQLQGAQPTVSTSQDVPYIVAPNLNQATNAAIPTNYTPSNCGTPTSNVQVVIATYFIASTGTLTVYLYNSVDTNQAQGYLMSSPQVALYAGGYTNPSTFPAIYILWNGVVSTAVVPSVTLFAAGSCTPLPAQTITSSSIPASSLPNGGNENGATPPVPATAPSCPLPPSTINGTQFNYTVVNSNDLKILTYTNTSNNSTGAFVLSYPGTSVAGIPLCTGSISPYQNLFIKWDGSGLTASSIVVTYNCTVLSPSIQTITGLNAANIPAGPGVCTTVTQTCGGNGGNNGNGGGGGGSNGDKKVHPWVWWVIGIIVVLIIVGAIVGLVIALHHRHGSLSTPPMSSVAS